MYLCVVCGVDPDDCRCLLCRRCKDKFSPKKEETRCPPCLTKRSANRLEKRTESRAQARAFASIDLLMKSNGVDKRRKRSGVRPV